MEFELSASTNRKRARLRPRQHCGMLCVVVRPSPIHGEGLFALCTFKPGDTICRSEGYIVNSTTRCLEPWESRISYEVSANHHFVPTGIAGEGAINALAKVNHGCDPNSYVQFDHQSGFLALKALRNISADEEITCDYCATETELAHPFFCRCGMDNCRGFIRGARFKTR